MLGKNKQGIAIPIRAELRPKNMVMDFNDFRETSIGLPSFSVIDEQAEKMKELKHQGIEKLCLKDN